MFTSCFCWLVENVVCDSRLLAALFSPFQAFIVSHSSLKSIRCVYRCPASNMFQTCIVVTCCLDCITTSVTTQKKIRNSLLVVQSLLLRYLLLLRYSAALLRCQCSIKPHIWLHTDTNLSPNNEDLHMFCLPSSLIKYFYFSNSKFGENQPKE